MKPNVLCVGFAKCGTTTLYDIMKQHPDIYVSGIKEPIYYGSKELVEKKGFEWYQRRYYSQKIDRKIIMEINPIIGRDIPALQILKDYGEKTKIIFLIRNPIDRIYSEFKMNLIDGTCFSTLKDNLGSSTKEMFDKWIRINFIKDEIKGEYSLLNNYCTKFCESGNYYSKIRDYIEMFGRDNVKIVFFEDFIKAPKDECSKIFNFIGIDCNEPINYNLHSNDGTRLPKSVLSMRTNQIWFLKIYKQMLIEKVPFISDNMCKFINYLTWKAPIILSKANHNLESMSDDSKEILTKYYYDMIEDLSNLMELDLNKKWNIKILKQ